MKYIIAVPDGASDQLTAYPDGNTPMRVADTQVMDELADCAEVGWAKTVPDSHHPGSDVAFLSIFGYDPASVYSGRAPLEAASMGLELGENIAFRCNLVTIHDETMKEFTAGHISTEEANELIEALNDKLGGEKIAFHTGVQYRHILVASQDYSDVECTPPHDILDRPIQTHLPVGPARDSVVELMERSKAIFATHPVNEKRIAAGKPPATQIWLWGQGCTPHLEPYSTCYGLQGGVISAVDLIKGIGRLAGLDVIEVEGATGLPDTNYEGKAEAALRVLDDKQFVCIHVESPDEMGHAGDEAAKTGTIRDFDQRMLKYVVEGLRGQGTDFRLLVLPDHPTPIALRTHVNEPVPYLLYDSRYPEKRGEGGYSEWSIKSRTDRVLTGHKLVDLLCEKITITDAEIPSFSWD